MDRSRRMQLAELTERVQLAERAAAAARRLRDRAWFEEYSAGETVRDIGDASGGMPVCTVHRGIIRETLRQQVRAGESG